MARLFRSLDKRAFSFVPLHDTLLCMSSNLDAIIHEVLADPVAAHEYFFAHRHTDQSPEFFEEVILDIYDFDRPKVLEFMFRGGAKSTILEEAMTILACLKIIHYGIIVGAAEPEAASRLASVKHELESNEKLIDVFGNLMGEPWGYARAQLKNNVLLQAKGRGQTFRGVKHLSERPDFLFLDDFEDDESMGKEGEGGDNNLAWLMKVAMPAMNPKRQFIRMAATPIHPRAACVQLSKDPTWLVHKIPVYYHDPVSGKLVSTWEARFPLAKMLKEKEDFERLGKARDFAQEYLCEAEHQATKAFDVTTIQCTPLQHSYEPTVLIVDPARSTKASSSLTGYVVASFSNSRIIVWEAFGGTHRPSDIINTVFDLAQRFNPTFIGIERDGLEEFIFQPMRSEMVSRGIFLPIRPIKAPKNKHEFIRSLQPFITSGDLVSAKPLPELTAQLQNFPAGKIDVLNALAYVPRMYPGEPVYQGFNPATHIIVNPLEEIRPSARVVYAVNATSTEAAVAGLIHHKSRIVIFDDVVIEGAPASAVPEALSYLRAQTARQGSLVYPRPLAQYDTLGLKAILRAQGETPSLGADPARARALLQQQLDSGKLAVAQNALWTLRSITSGYTYAPNTKEPNKNSYATLMQAIEAALPVFISQDAHAGGNYTVDQRSGVRHLTSRPNRHAG